jgi:beta-xylosidase
MDQGNTQVNGPHQGSWVTTPTGESWFLHFQDRGAYGRVLHLQPMEWVNDWPVIGGHAEGATKGEPVTEWKKPNAGKIYPVTYPGESDEFNDDRLGLQWQWQANPQPGWAMPFPGAGCLRLNAVPVPDSARNDWDVPAILLQKFPAETFTAVTHLHFNARSTGERCGLIVMGMSYADISLVKKNDGVYLLYGECLHASKGAPETERILARMESTDVLLKLQVRAGGICLFSYSTNGIDFIPVPGQQFTAEKGMWIGAKMGLYC